jgi:hypothetical protein
MGLSSNRFFYRSLVAIPIGGVAVITGFALLVGQDWLSMLLLLVVCTAGIGGLILVGLSWVIGIIILEIVLAARAALSRPRAVT